MTANHHLGVGGPRDVDVLKGVNMSFRRDAILLHGFDPRLRGQGAQVHSELSVCLPLRQRGLRVIYDPEVAVLHYPAPRYHGPVRGDLSAEAISASAHNEALAIIEYLPRGRRLIFALYGVIVGNTEAPGLAATIRDLLTRRPATLSRLVAAQSGRAAAWRTSRTERQSPLTDASGHGAIRGYA
jgi:hypothetical protein